MPKKNQFWSKLSTLFEFVIALSYGYSYGRIRIWNKKCQFLVRKVWKLTPKNVTQIKNYFLFFVSFCLKALFFALSNTYVKGFLCDLAAIQVEILREKIKDP